ncbi:hypothetical protein BJX63DRAFT_417687 [Aspergillus granulosus]|uniref:Uncharacterized protein n=1 Tax=Aspergillus granulosus TaxID=176169 RepID=A0ABR4I4H1_9EURO
MAAGFDGRKVLITGTGSGIGQATAQKLSSLDSTQLPFNCAEINPANIPITEATDAYCTRLMVDILGTFNMSRACVPLLSTYRVTADSAGTRGTRFTTQKKHAIASFTKELAMELSPCEIRVNAVAPEPTDTLTMADNVEGRDANNRFVSGVSLRRLGQVSEVACTNLADYMRGGENLGLE